MEDLGGERVVSTIEIEGSSGLVLGSADQGEGKWPVWDRDDGSLYYLAFDAIVRVPISRSGAVARFMEPEVFYRGPQEVRQITTQFDVMPDGRLLLMLMSGRSPMNPPAPPLTVVLNWREALEGSLDP